MRIVRIGHSTLEDFTMRLTAAVGAPPEIAEQVARSLVAADCRGHDTHGVFRIPWYAERIDRDDIRPTAEPRVEQLSSVALAVDGRRSFGQVVGRVAVAAAVERAQDSGIAVVGIKDGTHLGRLGEWGERAANAGMVLLGFVKGTKYTVAPPRSADRSLSTNPLVFAVPTFDALNFPIVLDMATSQVANGKIRKLETTDGAVPEQWTTTADASAVTDPTAFLEDRKGALLPLGGEVTGHKGFGLAVIVELFASLIGNSPVAGQAAAKLGGNDAAFVVVDPTLFSQRSAIVDRIDAFDAYVKSRSYADHSSSATAGADEFGLLPGEPEHRRAEEQRRTGIELDEGIATLLYEFALDRGITEIPRAIEANARRE